MPTVIPVNPSSADDPVDDEQNVQTFFQVFLKFKLSSAWKMSTIQTSIDPEAPA